MDAFRVEGPAKLNGEVAVSGSKNSALPLLFSSLLFDDPITFENVPRLWDIETTLKILETLGSTYDWNKETGSVVIDPKVSNVVAPYELVKKMRAGILALGPLVAKCGEARVSLPGGCAIGARPVDFHLEAMRKMGVHIEVEGGYIRAQVAKRVHGANIRFPQVTVTGTENIMILASVADGITRIENAACEPEVIAVGKMLLAAGARIEGLGTSVLEIEGASLKAPSTAIRVPPDRIETGTWISIAAATRSPLVLNGVDVDELASVLEAFKRIGVRFDILNGGKSLRVHPDDRYEAIDLQTAPYPLFPTDMQAQILTVLCLAEGTSRVTENIFENRFMHVAELRRLGAKISVEGRTAFVHGPAELRGAPVMATDLRASACLVVAALCAEGTSTIGRIYHLDRGYQRLDEKLQKLGARVTRIPDAL